MSVEDIMDQQLLSAMGKLLAANKRIAQLEATIDSLRDLLDMLARSNAKLADMVADRLRQMEAPDRLALESGQETGG